MQDAVYLEKFIIPMYMTNNGMIEAYPWVIVGSSQLMESQRYMWNCTV